MHQTKITVKTRFSVRWQWKLQRHKQRGKGLTLSSVCPGATGVTIFCCSSFGAVNTELSRGVGGRGGVVAPKYADISRLCVSFEAGYGWFCCEEQRPTERLNLSKSFYPLQDVSAMMKGLNMEKHIVCDISDGLRCFRSAEKFFKSYFFLASKRR